MKIFITGGTGFIGKFLVRRLIREGFEVAVLTRNVSAKRQLETLGAKVVIGDINDQKGFLNHLKKADTVIHLAAIRANWGDAKDFIKTNTDSVRNLFTDDSKIKHIIFTSSVYALGRLNNLPASENSPARASDLYGMSKRLAEEIVKKQSVSYKIPYTIIRPAIVYGPEDNNLGMLVKMIKLIKDRKFFIIGKGDNLLHLIYIDDLIEGFIKAVRRGGSNQTYILAGPKPIRLKNLVSLIQKNLEIKSKIRRIPKLPAYIAAFIFESLYRLGYFILPKLFKNEPPISLIKVKTLSDDWFYDISRAKKELGFNPKVGYDMGIKRLVDWYLRR